MQNYKKLWPILIILIIWLTLFRQFIFKGLLPIPADITVGMYYPWLDYKWGFSAGVPVKNPLMSDVPSLHYPWRTEAINQLKSGHWPLWNQYYFMGMPLLANFQSAPFSYINLYYLFFRNPIAWSLGVITSPILTMIFMYWFLKRKNLNNLPALFGSTTFALSGFQIAWLEYNVLGHTALFLPVILLLTDYWFESKSRKALLLLPIATAFQIFTGYVPIVIYTWLVVGLYLFLFYFLPLIFLQNKVGLATRIKSIVTFSLMVLWGILLSSLQLFPGYELVKLSIRKVDPIVELSKASFLPVKNFLTSIFPDIFGNPATGNYFGHAYYDNYYFFAGTVTILLTLLSFRLVRKNKQVAFYWFLLLFSLVMATDNPFGKLINQILMLRGGVAARSLFITDFALTVLASFGAEWFISSKKHKKLLMPTLLWGVMVLAAVLYVYSIPDIVRRQIAARNLIIPGAIIFTALLVIFIPKINKNYKVTILLLLTVGQLLYSANKYLPFSKEDLIFPRTPVIDFLIRQKTLEAKPFRVEIGNVIPQNMLMPYGIETTSGYDALLPKKNAQFFSLLESGRVEDRLSRVWLLSNYNSPYFLSTNTKYILAKKMDIDRKFTMTGNPPEKFNDYRYKLVFEDKTVQVYEDTKYLPRFQWLSGDGDIIWNQYKPNLISLTVSHPKADDLIYHGVLYPDWKFYLDDKLVTKITEKAGYVMLPVPEGPHTVLLRYQPNIFTSGLKVSIGSFVLFLLCIVVVCLRKITTFFSKSRHI